MHKIIRNAIQCKHCGDTIESENVHGYVTCSCGACSVDGGHDYLRRTYLSSPDEDYVELSESVDDNSGEKQQNQYTSVTYNSETEAAMVEAIRLSKDPETKKYANFADAAMDMMSEEELHEKLQEGFDDLEAGRTRPAKEVFEEFGKQNAIHSAVKKLSYDGFLKAFEHDDIYPVDETSFYFSDDPKETDHYLGCLREYEKPYWVGYCDIPDGCEYSSAKEMLEAKIFDGKSIKERWDSVVLCTIGGIPVEDWLDQYGAKLI